MTEPIRDAPNRNRVNRLASRFAKLRRHELPTLIFARGRKRVLSGILFLLRLGIEIRVEVIGRDGRVHAVGWHLTFRNPDESVQHRLAKIIVAPVVVEMAAGETKADRKSVV